MSGGHEGLRGFLGREVLPLLLRLSRLDSRVESFLRSLPGDYLRGDVIMIALGKGAAQMAEGACRVIEPSSGVVVIPRGSRRPRVPGVPVIEAGHPVPDEGSLEAGEAVLELAGRAGSRDLVVFLISGGGSALVESPVPPLTLEDLAETTNALLLSGASIEEINTVRKHLSRVKGGRLAAAAYPARLLSLYASDVPGDRLDFIASGPTVPDPTTFSDALSVLKRHGLTGRVPARVLRVLEAGARGEMGETPKPGDPRLWGAENVLIASNMDVLRGALEYLEGRGFNGIILTSRIEGEAREVGRVLASVTLEAINRGVPVGRPGAILAGGEATVKVRGRGRGGRNMELALSWAITMSNWGARDESAILSIDTDGIDGNTDSAGALIDPLMVAEAKERGMDPYEYLDDNDSYSLLRILGGTVETGPTGSNLNSVQVIVFA